MFCVLLGFFVGSSRGGNSGALKTDESGWTSLGKPPLPIDHLLFVDPYSVFVTTMDGEVFRRTIECESEPCWTISDSPDLGTTSWVTETLVIAETCQFQSEIKAPPGIVVECASLNNLMMVGGYLTAYYALLDDGSVSLWRHGASDIDYGIQSLGVLIYGLVGALIAIAVYTTALVILYRFAKRLRT
jgi:hypothetical protein